MLFPTHPVFPSEGIAAPHNSGAGLHLQGGMYTNRTPQDLRWKGPLAVRWCQDVHAVAVQAPPELPVISALGGGTDKDTT